VVAEPNCARGSLVVAKVLREGKCRLSVVSAVDVGYGLRVLGLIGVAACDDEGEAEEAGRRSSFAEDRAKRVLHKVS
jgi:hypothetical protein